MLEILGDYLGDKNQSDPVRDNILTAFVNICAEQNENLKEAVIRRGRVLDILCNELHHNDLAIINIPWLLYNLYCQQVTLLLNSD